MKSYIPVGKQLRNMNKKVEFESQKTPMSAEKADFKLVSKYEPRGDQPQAIKELVEGLERNDKFQTLLGVTGSGKTFSIASMKV